MQRSSSTLNNINAKNNYSYIKSKLYEKNNNKTPNNAFTYKDSSFISDYERVHWAHIKDRAGIIENDSPYIDKQSKEYIEKKQNEKKWIDKKNFNIFVGKASSLRNSFQNEIKNYVVRTPSLPPIQYQFRKIQKTKWIDTKDFRLY